MLHHIPKLQSNLKLKIKMGAAHFNWQEYWAQPNINYLKFI